MENALEILSNHGIAGAMLVICIYGISYLHREHRKERAEFYKIRSEDNKSFENALKDNTDTISKLKTFLQIRLNKND